ncbi:cyclin-J18-like protein [Carex littledalei]|uniref:Cyclin-J18-like protein n=1 Tax=Carex littledalei TaxID=544730 RepID=A0A833RER8_9POAL|nr:cyclin-J18-like protein [Carex littledalei]
MEAMATRSLRRRFLQFHFQASHASSPTKANGQIHLSLLLSGPIYALSTKVMGYDIGTSKIAFLFLEDLFLQLRELSKLGEAIEMETCMEIMDLLYEEDTTYPLFTTSSHSLAAAILGICGTYHFVFDFELFWAPISLIIYGKDIVTTYFKFCQN